jgi:hypothetical protein
MEGSVKSTSIHNGRVVTTALPLTLILVIYLAFLAGLTARYGFNPSGLIGIGERNSSYTPARLGSGIVVFRDSDGYDGQYFYYIAQDPFFRRGTFANPVRYQRIGYPLLVWLLSLGKRQLIPVMMVVVNLLAVVFGSWLFINLLRQYDLSPWYSLLFAFNPGEILGVQMDLAFPLQMALAMGALIAWEKRRSVAASVLLAASILTSESAVLFLLPLVLAEAMARRWREVITLALSVIPYLVYQGVLWVCMGAGGIGVSAQHLGLPFVGMGQVLLASINRLSLGPLMLARQGAVLAIMAVMLASTVLSAWKLTRGYEVYTSGVLCHASASLLGSYAIWEAYASAGRVFSGLFPLLVLSYGARRERWSPILLGVTAALGLLTLLRPFLISPQVPFFVTP